MKEVRRVGRKNRMRVSEEGKKGESKERKEGGRERCH